MSMFDDAMKTAALSVASRILDSEPELKDAAEALLADFTVRVPGLDSETRARVFSWVASILRDSSKLDGNTILHMATVMAAAGFSEVVKVYTEKADRDAKKD